MAKRKIAVLELDGAQVTTEALPYERAEDLMPEIAQLLGAASEAIAPLVASGAIKGEDDVVRLLPVIGPIAMQLGGGRLKRLVPQILATTTVILDESGEKTKFDLVKLEDRAACFDERPDIYFQVLWHAGQTTFARFFPGRGRRARKPGAPTETPSS